MNSEKKFLVEIVDNFTNKQIFFAVWFIIVGIFVFLMYRYYQKGNKRNFK